MVQGKGKKVNVRKLRITMPVQGKNSSGIESVKDPVMLAHRLMDLESRSENRYFDHRLRMSAMHNVCVRGQLLGYRNHLVTKDFLPVGMRLTFDIGNAIHHFLQNSQDYLGMRRMGWWECLACGNREFGRKPRGSCPKCGASSRARQYLEHALNLPRDIPVSGHIDGFLEVEPGDIRVIDFKTINGEDFESLASPKPEHCIQVNGYMNYVQIDDTLPVRINPDKGLVLYISKKHTVKTLPFKMFQVRREKIFMDVIEEKVANFRRGLEDNAYLPPPLSSCVASGFKSASCRSCRAYAECLAEYSKDGKSGS